MFGELCPGACASGFCPFQCLGCVVSGPWRPSGCLVLKNQDIRHSFMPKKPLLDIYNLTVKLCLAFRGCLRGVCMASGPYTDIFVLVFLSVCQSGCGRSVNPTHALPAASLSILNSLDFNVFLYRAGKGPCRSLGHEKKGFCFPCKVKSAVASLSTPLQVVLQREGGKWGLWNCLQVTATLMPLPDPVTQFGEEIRI